MDKFNRFKQASTGERLQHNINMRAYVDESSKSLNKQMDEMRAELLKKVTESETRTNVQIKALRDEIKKKVPPKNKKNLLYKPGTVLDHAQFYM